MNISPVALGKGAIQMTIILSILVIIGLGIITSSIMSAITSRQSSKTWRRPSRLARVFAPDYNAFNRFGSPVPRPYRAMENLKQEIRETRRHAVRASHRPRPR
jgi:hypothetical protein